VRSALSSRGISRALQCKIGPSCSMNLPGPLFRPIDRHGHISKVPLSDKAVSLIVKRAAAAAGL
jgi:hypothetical protein